MGYVICTGPCLVCSKLFSFNPHKVPSSSAVTGHKEPICETCMTHINVTRKVNGMPEFDIAEDAYEAIEESAL